MTRDVAALFAKIDTEIYQRIKDAAAEESRSITKWVELHFKAYFQAVDACNNIGSEPDSTASAYSPSRLPLISTSSINSTEEIPDPQRKG